MKEFLNCTHPSFSYHPDNILSSILNVVNDENLYYCPGGYKRNSFHHINGIWRSLNGLCLITEVKQRRVRFIIGWMIAWDCQVLYTLVGLREPRKLDGSSDWLWVGRKKTSMDVLDSSSQPSFWTAICHSGPFWTGRPKSEKPSKRRLKSRYSSLKRTGLIMRT